MCIRDSFPQRSGRKQKFKISNPHPGTVKYALLIVEILKCQYNTAHRQIAKNLSLIHIFMIEQKEDRGALNRNLAQMLKGGVIMDVTTPEQAKIAEAQAPAL